MVPRQIRKMLSELKLVVARCGVVFMLLALLSTIAAADARGSYRSEVEVRGHQGSTKLEYVLKLDRDDRATLSVKRKGRVEWDRDARIDYGEVLDYLDRDDSVQFDGRWNERRDEINVDFDRVSRGSGRAGSMRFSVDGNTLNLRDADRELFGRQRLQLTKIRKDNTGTIIAAAAVIGAIAIIASNDRGGDELRRGWDGDGDLVIGRDRFGGERVRKVDIQLKRGGDFVIKVDSRTRVEAKGRWRKTRDDYDLEFREIKIGRHWQDARGSGFISMGRDKRDLRRITFSVQLRDRGEYASLDFSPRRR